MKTILVTGGTGSLGRPTVKSLRAAGHSLRILSRQPGVDHVRGDLTTNEGIAAAVADVGTVLHLATSRRHADVQQTKNLIEHAKLAGVDHLILISIVGIEQIPMPYYRDKVTIERLVTESEIPFTILRATQFHDLVDELLTAQRFLPALLAPAISLQPISAADVAARLTELAANPPAGRVADLGGPERLTVPAMTRAWKRAKRSRRPVLPIRLPGKAFRAFANNAALTDTVEASGRTFDDYLSRRYGVRA